MELKDFPNETLDLIISHLFEFADKYDSDAQNPEHLANARLVCQQWNELASRHLFSSIHLRHRSGAFEKWNTMLDNETIRSSVRQVHIDSSPPFEDDYEDECDWDLWVRWQDEGEYPEFIDSLNRIGELRNLTSLVLHFGRACRTGEYDFDSEASEPLSSRKRTLHAVFDAMAKRTNESPGATTIRSLTIENLQNFVLDDFTGSDAFEQVMQGLKGLHVLVADEENALDEEREADLYRPERQNFEPHLRQAWLDPIAEQLTSLSLLFHCGWGVMPGKFDTSGLSFPNLRTLHLGAYIIAHHNQLDWVLRQTTLHTLRLERCAIASHLRIGGGHRQLWDIQDTDWVKHPRGAFGFNSEDDEIYTFEGTWADVFKAIRESLPNLLDFRFSRFLGSFSLDRPDLMENEQPHPARYFTFDTGYCSGWIDDVIQSTFDIDDPEPIDIGSGPTLYIKKRRTDRGVKTYEEDLRALEDLVASTRRNRSC
ncbi:unnamed protein product [Clonostachys solani]|uniref:F-box domain-containing protein n=1 Tax=Clonostachys solani TaxID=160281 RepID=A0A9P0ERJ6_9HYPO|nr:unnamed protein product [Clonostachys solani]